MSHASTLSAEEKQALYRDGYVVAKQAVAPELVSEALARIKRARKGENLGSSPEMTDLVNASMVTPILHEAMGQFDPPSACQVGVIKPQRPGDHYNNLGYVDRDMPYFGAESHMDGLITIAAPQTVQEGTPEEIYQRYFASGPKGDLGRSADVMGHNYVPMFQDPEMTLGMGSFTAFVFVCLNDQTKPGCGQTSILKGAHHLTQEFFRWQAAQGDVLGPEGPGWPRLNHAAPNRCGLVYLPEMVRDRLLDDDSLRTPDGVAWARPTQVLMEPGDACIALFHVPHSGSRNELGTESRKNIIFRIRNKSRQPNKIATGVSDHPDRGFNGEWLAYEDGNNPWQRSKHHLCNMWDEWEGMQQIVAANRPNSG